MPPRAVPSSLVSTMPLTPAASREQLRLAQPVLAGGRIDGQQRLVRRALELAGDHAPHLGQLGHQVVLGVQAPGGVDDHHVDARWRAPARRLEGDRAGIGALRAGDDLAARALAPTPPAARSPRRETCRPRRAARCARARCAVPGELADRRRLAGAVDADHQDHGRLGADVDAPRLAARVSASSSIRRSESASPPLEPPSAASRSSVSDDRGGRGGAHVGHDQRLLQALPGVLVERREQRRLDLRAERLAGL